MSVCCNHLCDEYLHSKHPRELGLFGSIFQRKTSLHKEKTNATLLSMSPQKIIKNDSIAQACAINDLKIS